MGVQYIIVKTYGCGDMCPTLSTVGTNVPRDKCLFIICKVKCPIYLVLGIMGVGTCVPLSLLQGQVSIGTYVLPLSVGTSVQFT